MKRKLFTLLTLLVLSTGVVLMLYYWSLQRKPQFNGFSRILDNSHIVFQKVMDLPYSSSYMAGFSKDHVYIGSRKAPLRLLVWNKAFTDSQSLQVRLDTVFRYYDPSFAVDSPYFWITDYGTKTLIRGDLYDLKATVLPLHPFFAEAVPLNQYSLILRTLDTSAKTYVLKKRFVTAEKDSHEIPLEAQLDGTFSTDGMLKYDACNGSLTYVYFYRNKFLYVDTSMHLLYKGNTIDTNTHAKLKLAKIASEQVIKMAAPPFVVNKYSDVYNHRLFIQSALRADNESQNNFAATAVVDVYDLQMRQYLYSFHLDHITPKQLKSFRVYDHTLLAFADQKLFIYELIP